MTRFSVGKLAASSSLFIAAITLLAFHSSFLSSPDLQLTADASAEVLGGPASPLAVQVSDVNKNYVFLTWQPPSADGVSHVEGYYVEK